MADFVIIPDTSSDLSKPLRERFGIPAYISGLIYFPDGHSESADLDWEHYDPKTFYESMTDKKTLYKTACAPIGNIMQVYEDQLAQGKDVLGITLSSALSGTYQMCQMAREELLKKYPERKIICIDSLRYSSALSLLVLYAAKLRDEGKTIEETAQLLEQNKHRIHQMGPMDDLFFLVKTGRISNFKAFFGSLVGINPMADFNREGLSQVLGKFKGKKAAFDAVIEYMHKTIEDPQDQIIFIGHSNREAAAQVLAQRVEETFHPKEIIINQIGMSCGCSIGPGLCAAYYFGRELSEGMTYETQVMDTIISNQKNKR